MEAIQLAQQRKFDTARDLAESVLQSNPNNTTAIQVNASECESRQDWGTAVRSAGACRACVNLSCARAPDQRPPWARQAAHQAGARGVFSAG